MKESSIRQTKSKEKPNLEEWLEGVYNDCLNHHTIEFGQLPLIWQNSGKYSHDELKEQLKEELIRQEALKSALAINYFSRRMRAEWLVYNHYISGTVTSVMKLIERREAALKKLKRFRPLQELAGEFLRQV